MSCPLCQNSSPLKVSFKNSRNFFRLCVDQKRESPSQSQVDSLAMHTNEKGRLLCGTIFLLLVIAIVQTIRSNIGYLEEVGSHPHHHTPAAEMNRERVHLLVTGKVQDVWLREYTRKKALRLHITGWARNLKSGNEVEIIAEGRHVDLDVLIKWLREEGSPSSHVKDVRLLHRVKSIGSRHDFKTFETGE